MPFVFVCAICLCYLFLLGAVGVHHDEGPGWYPPQRSLRCGRGQARAEGATGPVTDASRLTREDFTLDPASTTVEDRDPLAPLKQLYDVDDVVESLTRLVKSTVVANREGRTVPLSNWLFLGNSGTGKTTIARTMGKILHTLKLLPTDKVVISSATDLTGSFVGQSKDKTRTAAEEARGGVLFIDEAYELGKNGYGEEVLVTLLALLTEDDFAGNMVVILAGYDDKMQAMMRMNQGVRSRFGSTLHLQDWSAEKCAGLVSYLAQASAMAVHKDGQAQLVGLFQELRRRPGFANARTATSAFRQAMEARDARVYEAAEHGEAMLTAPDIQAAAEVLLRDHPAAVVVSGFGAGAGAGAGAGLEYASASQSAAAPPPAVTAVDALATAAAVPDASDAAVAAAAAAALPEDVDSQAAAMESALLQWLFEMSDGDEAVAATLLSGMQGDDLPPPALSAVLENAGLDNDVANRLFRQREAALLKSMEEAALAKAAMEQERERKRQEAEEEARRREEALKAAARAKRFEEMRLLAEARRAAQEVSVLCGVVELGVRFLMVPFFFPCVRVCVSLTGGSAPPERGGARGAATTSIAPHRPVRRGVSVDASGRRRLPMRWWQPLRVRRATTSRPVMC